MLLFRNNYVPSFDIILFIVRSSLLESRHRNVVNSMQKQLLVLELIFCTISRRIWALDSQALGSSLCW